MKLLTRSFCFRRQPLTVEHYLRYPLSIRPHRWNQRDWTWIVVVCYMAGRVWCITGRLVVAMDVVDVVQQLRGCRKAPEAVLAIGVHLTLLLWTNVELHVVHQPKDREPQGPEEHETGQKNH